MASMSEGHVIDGDRGKGPPRFIYRQVGIGLLIVGICAAYILSPIAIQEYRQIRLRRMLHDRPFVESLLVASRQLIATAKLDSATSQAGVLAENWPPPIQELSPSWVAISTGKLHIELGGGFHHFGVHCYADGVQQQGDEKIIDGVWFVSGEK